MNRRAFLRQSIGAAAAAVGGVVLAACPSVRHKRVDQAEPQRFYVPADVSALDDHAPHIRAHMDALEKLRRHRSDWQGPL